jgi:hypothetical protein
MKTTVDRLTSNLVLLTEPLSAQPFTFSLLLSLSLTEQNPQHSYAQTLGKQTKQQIKGKGVYIEDRREGGAPVR